MQIIAILIGLVLLAAIAYYVSRPIVNRQREDADTTLLTTLELRRDAVYSQIRELDMDHATGKMNDEDYQRARADLVAQAAELLRQIDETLAAPLPAPISIATATLPATDDVEALIAARRKAVKPAPIQSGGDDDLEAAIAARRKVKVAPAVDDVEALIAARRKARPVQPAAADEVETLIASRRKAAAPAPVAAANCPNCGKDLSPDDAFCSKCGTPLKAAAH